MHKLNAIKLHVWLSLMLSIQCVSLHGMLSVKNEVDQKVLWDIVLANSLSYDDYDAHRNCALVDKNFHQIIEDTYRYKKKLIEKYIQTAEAQTPIPMTGYRSWNKDFSQCAWVNYDVDSSDPKDLQLTLVGIINNEVVTKSALWQEFCFPIFEDNIRPFFDEDGRACFYGQGKVFSCGGSFFSCAQYCINIHGNAHRYFCRFKYLLDPNNRHLHCGRDLYTLLQYPVLLKACLQSKLMDTNNCCNSSESVKNYHVNGIILPADYKIFKKIIALEQLKQSRFLQECRKFTSYDSLPDDVRKAIDYQYEKQQREKHNGDIGK